MLDKHETFIDIVVSSAKLASLKGFEAVGDYHMKNYADNYVSSHEIAVHQMIITLHEPYIESFAREFARRLVDNKYLLRELLFSENDE